MTKLREIARRAFPLVAAALLVLVVHAAAEACPNCKEGFSGNESRARNIAAGYYYSILFMLSMPVLLIGSFGGWMYLAVRRARAEREAAARQQADALPSAEQAEAAADSPPAQ